MVNHSFKLNPIPREEYSKGIIAVTHPGKIGDALYALPAIRHIARTNKAKIDFYTSNICKPALSLFEYQSCINRAMVHEAYTPQHTKIGVQPWHIPVYLGNYDKVIHLGFRREPDKRLDQFIAEQVGISLDSNLDRIYYEYPEYNIHPTPYIVLASGGRKRHLYFDTLKQFASICPIDIVEIGTLDDYLSLGTNCCGEDFLNTLPWIANSIGFVGMLSSNLVLANGFNIPKVCLVPRKGWKSSHAVHGPDNKYLLHPKAKQILEALEL